MMRSSTRFISWKDRKRVCTFGEGGGDVLFPPSAAVFEVLNVHELNGSFMIVLKEK